MKPGRELDALIVEKVMGLTLINSFWYEVEEPNGFQARIPEYSTDIAAAWEVVEKLKSPLTTLETCDVLGVLKWTCRLSKEGRMVSAMAETAPHAICLAALKFVSPD